MAFTVTRYRSSNPGMRTRLFDITSSLDADNSTTFEHLCGWTPDSWELFSTDGTKAQYKGMWRATVNATSVIVGKTPHADLDTAGTCRLLLKQNAVRP